MEYRAKHAPLLQRAQQICANRAQDPEKMQADMSYIANEIVNIGMLFAREAREKWLELRRRLIEAVKASAASHIDPQLYEVVSGPQPSPHWCCYVCTYMYTCICMYVCMHVCVCLLLGYTHMVR